MPHYLVCMEENDLVCIEYSVDCIRDGEVEAWSARLD